MQKKEVQPLTLDEYREILEEIARQPKRWRVDADREMDYADGNQLDSDVLKAQAALGIPPAVENLIGPALEGIRGHEQGTRTDWRVTPNGQPGGQDVADAINFKLNEAERHSKADDACGDAFYPQIGVGLGWVEVARADDPFAYPMRCRAIHRNEIHWDWHAQEVDLSDARWLRRQRWLHPQRLAQVFPEHKALIEKTGKHGAGWWLEDAGAMMEGGSTNLARAWDVARDWSMHDERWHNPQSKELCISELWYRRWQGVVVLKSPDGRAVEYDPDNATHVHALAHGLVKHQKAAVPRVRRSYWLGPHCLFDGETPYAHRFFPYVPFWGFREDATRVPYGYVRSMLYQQDTLNSGTSRLRWGMSAYRVERTDGVVDMPDAVFRRTVGRLDADIKLNAQAMSMQGARFKVERDFALNTQQFQLLDNARHAMERVNPAAAGAFSGRRGTATSGLQEQVQVEQAHQSLAHMMGNFRRARTQVGEMLMSMVVQDLGEKQEAVLIEGDAVRAGRTVVLNQPQRDPQTGMPYLSNDLQRTRLMVALEDVPATSSYRAQQLHAMSEAVKSLPAQYQAASMPFLAALMDVPFKRELVESLRAAGQQPSEQEVQARIGQAVQDALQKSAHDLKERELDMKERKTDAEVKEATARAVQIGVQAAFSAMQGGAQVAQMPQIAPIADAIMQAAGYQKPDPLGDDPDFPVPAGVQVPPEGVPGVRRNTSPNFPPVPQSPGNGLDGIETLDAQDNLPGP